MKIDLRILVVAAALFVGHASCPVAAQQPLATDDAVVAVGELAPDFTLAGQDGDFQLSDHRGEHVVVVFVRAHW